METSTITRVSREPFCPGCDGWLWIQGFDENTTIWAAALETRGYLGPEEVFRLICPWCGKALGPSEVIWRETKKGER